MNADSWRFGWFRRKRALKVAEARKPRKNRSGSFSALTFGAAAIAILLALFGVGPFAVQALVVNLGSGAPTNIAASSFFPSPSPQHKVVNVYDPAPAGGGDDHHSNPGPQASPSPNPHPSASPSPHPDD
jgi:hypothetical protein